MPVVIFTMLIILVLAAAIIAVVVMGMEGQGRSQHPNVADAMARTARHLNGEGEPPPALVALVGEMGDVSVPDLNVRQLPAKLRSMRSARSADSAGSEQSAESAVSPGSAPSTASADSPASAASAAPVDPELPGTLDDEFDEAVVRARLPEQPRSA